MAPSNDLTRQGIAALKAGDQQQAASLLKQAIREDKNNQIAWLWLSGCVDSDEDKIQCLERVVSIDATSEAGQRAARGLEQIQGLELPGEDNIAKNRQGQIQQKKEKIILFSDHGIIITPLLIEVPKSGLVISIESISAAQMSILHGQRSSGFALILFGGLSVLVGGSLLSDSLTWGGVLLLGIISLLLGLPRLFGKMRYIIELVISGKYMRLFMTDDKSIAESVNKAIQDALSYRVR